MRGWPVTALRIQPARRLKVVKKRRHAREVTSGRVSLVEAAGFESAAFLPPRTRKCKGVHWLRVSRGCSYLHLTYIPRSVVTSGARQCQQKPR